MYKSTIVALTLMGMVSAQSSVVDLYLYGFDDSENLIGSVIASDKTATTYSITCKSATAAATTTASMFFDDSDSDCGVPPSFTFTQGPSTIQYSYAYSDFESDSAYLTYSASSYTVHESMVLGCVITGSSSGVCSATQVGDNGVSSFSTADSTSFSDIAEIFTAVPVTITAGAIGSAPNTASATSTPTSSGSKSTGTASSSSGASGASASKASATGSSSTSASTGGMPMVTAKAQWVVGAAAAIAYAAM